MVAKDVCIGDRSLCVCCCVAGAWELVRETLLDCSRNLILGVPDRHTTHTDIDTPFLAFCCCLLLVMAAVAVLLCLAVPWPLLAPRSELDARRTPSNRNQHQHLISIIHQHHSSFYHIGSINSKKQESKPSKPSKESKQAKQASKPSKSSQEASKPSGQAKHAIGMVGLNLLVAHQVDRAHVRREGLLTQQLQILIGGLTHTTSCLRLYAHVCMCVWVWVCVSVLDVHRYVVFVCGLHVVCCM